MHSVTFLWKDRNGVKRSHEEVILPTETSVKPARLRAMQKGYPGHNGGRWNWFVEDMRRWMVGKKACPAKNCNIHRTGKFA